MNGLDGLREQGGMTWIEDGREWVAAPAEVLIALANDGFEECKREMKFSMRWLEFDPSWVVEIVGAPVRLRRQLSAPSA